MDHRSSPLADSPRAEARAQSPEEMAPAAGFASSPVPTAAAAAAGGENNAPVSFEILPPPTTPAPAPAPGPAASSAAPAAAAAAAVAAAAAAAGLARAGESIESFSSDDFFGASQNSGFGAAQPPTPVAGALGVADSVAGAPDEFALMPPPSAPPPATATLFGPPEPLMDGGEEGAGGGLFGPPMPHSEDEDEEEDEEDEDEDEEEEEDEEAQLMALLQQQEEEEAAAGDSAAGAGADGAPHDEDDDDSDEEEEPDGLRLRIFAGEIGYTEMIEAKRWYDNEGPFGATHAMIPLEAFSNKQPTAEWSIQYRTAPPTDDEPHFMRFRFEVRTHNVHS